MNTHYVGLDTGSTSCFYCIRDNTGDIIRKKRIQTSNDRIRSCFQQMDGIVQVHLEASSLAGHIRYLLKEIVDRVVVSDPAQNELIARDPRKGDPRDAGLLAELLRNNFYQEVWYPDDKNRWSFRQLVAHYDMFDKVLVSMKSRVHSRLIMNGVYNRHNAFGTNRKEELVEEVSYPMMSQVINQLYDTVDQLQQHKQHAKEKMWSFAQQFDEVNRFQEVPGVGPVVASRFSAYVGDPHRFDDNKDLRSYSKMGVSSRTSDERPLGYERLDREGRSCLKDASYMAFMSAVGENRDNAIARKYRQSKQDAEDQTNARLNTQRKILDTLWAIWRKDEEYDPKRVTSQ
jgi:transposase